jgi:hypothetical protein
MQRPRFSPVEVSALSNSRTVLYDSGYPHGIVRGLSVTIALVALVMSLDVLASFFNVAFLNHHAPLGSLIALLASSGLAWWCSMCAFARNVIYLDTESSRLLLYGPGYHFRLKEYSSVSLSKIFAIAVQYHHSPGPADRNDWSVDWVDDAGQPHELARMLFEQESRDTARRIGEAIGKPLE